MTEQEQKAFTAMREALVEIICAHPVSTSLRQTDAVIAARQALTAANAVSEPKVKLIPTAQEMGSPMQPQAQGEQRYLSIERVSGFPDKLDSGPQLVLYSDSINGCMVRRDDVWLALTSHLNPQATEPAWRPIETAPKSEKVLLWATKQKPHAFIGFWDEYDTYNQPRITHWMPLPAAPEAP